MGTTGTCTITEHIPVPIYQAQQLSESSEHPLYKHFRVQQLSLKHCTSCGQRHLVPAAPEACQILRRTITQFRCQEAQHNAGEVLGILLITSLLHNTGRLVRCLNMAKPWRLYRNADLVYHLYANKRVVPAHRCKPSWHFNNATQVGRIHKPHDRLHILPSRSSPEETNGSLSSFAYLNQPIAAC